MAISLKIGSALSVDTQSRFTYKNVFMFLDCDCAFDVKRVVVYHVCL